KDRDITVNFKTIPVPVNVSADNNPSYAGSVLGQGQYNIGDSATLTAVPSLGWYFEGWEDNGTILSTDPIYTFEVTGNMWLYAKYTTTPPPPKSVTVEITAEPLDALAAANHFEEITTATAGNIMTRNYA